MLKRLRDFKTSWLQSYTEVQLPGRQSPSLSHLYFTLSCKQPGYTLTVILQIKLFAKKKSRRPTAWRVQTTTSPSASTTWPLRSLISRANIRKEEKCKRQKDSWLLSKVSVSVDRLVSSSVIWAGNQGMGCPKELVQSHLLQWAKGHPALV